MKQILIILTLAFSIPVLAEEPSIADSMRVIGQNFGKIARALFNDEKVEESHVDNAKTIQSAATDAASKYPDTADTDERKAKYSQMMNELVREAQNIEQAIENVLNTDEEPQDLSQCKTIYMRMNQLRQEGHEEFQ